MLRSEAQVALDDLQRGSRHTAGLYSEDAHILGDAPLAELFKEMADQHERMAEWVEQQQRQLGDLPSGPDADRETLTQIKDRLQAQLSDDEYHTLLESRLHDEEELARQVRYALAQDLPPETAEVLEDVYRQVGLARRRLRAALGAL